MGSRSRIASRILGAEACRALQCHDPPAPARRRARATSNVQVRPGRKSRLSRARFISDAVYRAHAEKTELPQTPADAQEVDYDCNFLIIAATLKTKCCDER